jgi:hypothetical protein
VYLSEIQIDCSKANCTEAYEVVLLAMYGTKMVDLGKNYVYTVWHATISSMTYDSEKNCKIHISEKYSVNVT